MKVLVVIDSFGLGGAENLLAVLAGAAPAADLELHVASLTPPSMGRLALQPVLEQAGLQTSFLDVPRLAHPSAAWRVAHAIRSTGADVVHAHLGYSAILAPPAARMLGRGSVATLHHVPGREVGRERFKERLSLEIPGRLGTLVFVSDASRAGFARIAPERSSWRTVHNGIDDALRPRARRAVGGTRPSSRRAAGDRGRGPAAAQGPRGRGGGMGAGRVPGRRAPTCWWWVRERNVAGSRPTSRGADWGAG